MAAIMGDCSCGCGECCGCDCEELAGEVLEDDLYLADGAGGLPGTYHEPYPDGLDGSTGTMAKYTFGGPCYWVDFTLVAVGLTALFCESGAWHELSGGTFSPLSTFNVVCDPFRVDVHLWYVVFDEWRHLKIRFTCSEKGITDSGGNALVDSSGNEIRFTCSEKGITDSGGNALVDSSGNAIWYSEKGITDSGGNALVDSSGNAIWYKE